MIAGQDVFDEAEVIAGRRSRRSERNLFLSDFRDLKPGDYVVHIDHGIGRFEGLKSINLQEGTKEFVLLGYQDDARLYVPVERLDLIQKYSNVGGARPDAGPPGRHELGKTKTRIRKSMRDMAEELLKLYAERRMVEGFSFSRRQRMAAGVRGCLRIRADADQADAIASVKSGHGIRTADGPPAVRRRGLRQD